MAGCGGSCQCHWRPGSRPWLTSPSRKFLQSCHRTAFVYISSFPMSPFTGTGVCSGADGRSSGSGICGEGLLPQGPIPQGRARHQGHSGRCGRLSVAGPVGLVTPALTYPIPHPAPRLPQRHCLLSTWPRFLASGLFFPADACARPGSRACRSRPDLGEGSGRNWVRGLARLTRH